MTAIDQILRILSTGPRTAQQVMHESGYSPRMVRYTLTKLRKAKVVRKCPNLMDMRQHLYGLTTGEGAKR